MDEGRQIAERVRQACVDAALEAYEDAQIRGLCREGAWEVAIEAIRQVDIVRIIGETSPPTKPD